MGSCYEKCCSVVGVLLVVLLASAIASAQSAGDSSPADTPGTGNNTDFWLGAVYFAKPFQLGDFTIRSRMNRIKEALGNIPQKFDEEMAFHGVNFDKFRDGVVELFVYDFESENIFRWHESGLLGPIVRLPHPSRVQPIERVGIIGPELLSRYDDSQPPLQGSGLFDSVFLAALQKNSTARLLRVVDVFADGSDAQGSHSFVRGWSYLKIRNDTGDYMRNADSIRLVAMHELGHSWHLGHIGRQFDASGATYVPGNVRLNLMEPYVGTVNPFSPNAPFSSNIRLNHAQALHVALRYGGEPAAFVRVPSAGVGDLSLPENQCGNTVLDTFEELDTPLIQSGAPLALHTVCIDQYSNPPSVPSALGTVPQLTGLAGTDPVPTHYCVCINDHRRYDIKVVRSGSDSGLFEPDDVQFTSQEKLLIESSGHVTVALIDTDSIDEAYGAEELGLEQYTRAVWDAEARRATVYVEPQDQLHVDIFTYDYGERLYVIKRTRGSEVETELIRARQPSDRTPYQLAITPDHWRVLRTTPNKGYFEW